MRIAALVAASALAHSLRRTSDDPDAISVDIMLPALTVADPEPTISIDAPRRRSPPTPKRYDPDRIAAAEAKRARRAARDAAIAARSKA